MTPMSHRALVLAAVVVAAPGVARADPDKPQPLPGGMQLVIAGGRVNVERGAVRAPLAIDGPRDQMVDDFDKVVIDAAARKVTIDVTMCNTSGHAVYTLDALEARLANVEALAAHHKKDYATAATGFARAAQLDPDFDLAAENLASALALGGKPDQAVAALAPWIAKNPTWVYARVATDPELASLRQHKAIVALRARKPGTATVKDGTLAGLVAWSATRRQVAVVHGEGSWGSCNWFAELQVFDVATGARRATLPLVEWADTSPECEGTDRPVRGLDPAHAKAVTARVAAAQGLLRELGFSPARLEKSVGDHGSDDLRLPRAKLVVRTADVTAEVVRAGTVIARGAVLGNVDSAWLVPDAKAIVLGSGRAGSEGCEGSDPTMITVVPLP
jgi:hypothetical protein